MKTLTLRILVVLIILISIAFGGYKQKGGTTSLEDKDKPEIIHVGMAAPDIIVLTVQAQWVDHGIQIPYKKQPGDSIAKQRQHRFIVRNGETIGSLSGKDNDTMCTPDKMVGEPLDTFAVGQTGSYLVSFRKGGEGMNPVAVYRKSKPVDCMRSPARTTSPVQHTIILKLDGSLEKGKSCTVEFPEGLLALDKVTFDFDPATLRSEAVHVNQVGYRPDDPVKLAFLSFWMGDGGGLAYPEGFSFRLVEDETGEEVFSGKARLARGVNHPDNITFTEIHELDFSGFDTLGKYRISVDGVGCSFPFEIGRDVWKKAYIKSMRGLYCQRSGIELGSPYTEFVRTRGFIPGENVTVYVSEPPAEGEDPSLRELNPELQTLLDSYEATGRFQRLLDNLTNRVLPYAWGGYMDAGDWDRRPDHALMPLIMFDLEEMFPETFAGWTHHIPDSQDDLPDLVNEALWLVDFLVRMQQEDGSVYAGIESGEHPRRCECSWQESLPVIAYGRTQGSAYNLAADAARAAYWFQIHEMTDKAEGYRESVSRAFAWAEEQPTRQPRDFSQGIRPEDPRCLAAAELFRLTGEEKYHEIFLSTTRFSSPEAPFFTAATGPTRDAQGQAGWTYLQTEQSNKNREIEENIYNAMIRDADRLVENCMETDFHWAGGTRRQIRWGALSMPESHVLCRAHFLTRNEKYLDAIILSTLSGAGANPVNMCYVTGVGSSWPQHPLHEDAYYTHQPLYEGVTIGGPIDPGIRNKHGNARRVEPLVYPSALAWPPTESYFDVWVYVPMNEFTVHQTMLPTSFVWGYLAARR